MPANSASRLLLLIAVAVAAASLLTVVLGHRARGTPATTYSDLITRVERQPSSISSITFKPRSRAIDATLSNETVVSVHYPSDQSQAQFQNLLQRKHVEFDSQGIGASRWRSVLGFLLPLVLVFALWIFLMGRLNAGGGSKVMSFGKSRAKRMTPDSPKIGFKDVAGVDEAVEELQEIKEFLENPKKFQALGARIPKGVLLYGPPGTGKTLLARAVAGEAGVPFFSISGSDFVEMFVGVGASRVRDLFEQAKQASPCIVFMDEIDAVGRHRGAGLGGGHDEREQTLNQLLVEMDGFELKDNIILIAATNRPDILDPALLRARPLRPADRRRPPRPRRPQEDPRGALEGQAARVRRSTSTRSRAGTPGFTGADLANLVNEAALLAARRGKKTIEQEELEEGIMRVIAGPEKKTRLFSEKERRITAYHEMGHALVGHFLEHTNPIHKITIVSRGQALGLTISLPTEDRYMQTTQALLEEIATTLGGRAAEETRLPRGDDGRGERPREGHVDCEANGDALRDEREARPARARPQPRHAVPRPRDVERTRLLGGGRARDRRRDPPRHRGGARARALRAARAHGRAAQHLADPDRARDDRQGPVRAAARRRGRKHGLPRGRVRGRDAEAARGASRRGEETRPHPAAEVIPASRNARRGTPRGVATATASIPRSHQRSSLNHPRSGVRYEVSEPRRTRRMLRGFKMPVRWAALARW